MKPINNNEIIFDFLVKVMNRKCADLNIRAFVILYYVYVKKEVLSIMDYAKIFRTNKTQITRLTDKLVARCLISKSYDPKDRRKVAILPAPKREVAVGQIFDL